MNRIRDAVKAYWRWSGTLEPWEARTLARLWPLLLFLIALSVIMIVLEDESAAGEPPPASSLAELDERLLDLSGFTDRSETWHTWLRVSFYTSAMPRSPRLGPCFRTTANVDINRPWLSRVGAPAAGEAMKGGT